MKRLKIGLLTFHRAHNYGAVLQAYALMRTLQDLGHDAEIIDYWPKYREGHYDMFNFKHELKRFKKEFSTAYLKDATQRIFSFPYKWINYSKFSGFIKNYLHVEGVSLSSGAGIPDRYNAIIVGSDQIWRHKFKGLSGFDEVYFAKYPLGNKAIKLSYAASMGDSDPDAEGIKDLPRLLKNLDFVGIRETALMKLVKPLTAKQPMLVLDPVFLLAKKKWESLVKPNLVKKRYLLFYQLLANKKATAIATQIAKEKGLQLIEIRGTHGIENSFGSKLWKHTAGPLDFLSLVYHAEYIVSTSFHGVAFSTVFEKQFCTLGFKNKGYRINSLLESFGIEHCLVTGSLSQTPTIDYADVTPRLEKMRENSIGFLKTSLTPPTAATV